MAWLKNSPLERVVLFGGVNPTGATLGDTGVWEGTTWRQPIGPMPPTPLMAAMGSDLLRGRVVLFGGCTSSTGTNDTWLFSGTNWTQHAVAGKALSA